MPSRDPADDERAGDAGPAPVLPRLRADTLAQFDPVSGLLVVNIAQDEFLEAFRRFALGNAGGASVLITSINHEPYHYFQTIRSRR